MAIVFILLLAFIYVIVRIITSENQKKSQPNVILKSSCNNGPLDLNVLEQPCLKIINDEHPPKKMKILENVSNAMEYNDIESINDFSFKGDLNTITYSMVKSII